MKYRAHLEPGALRQMLGLPEEAFAELVRLLAHVCEDPYDRLFSMPTMMPGEPRRMAELGDSAGFIVFGVDETAGLVRVFDLVWTG